MLNREKKWTFGPVSIIYRTTTYPGLGIDEFSEAETNTKKVIIDIPFDDAIPINRMDSWAYNYATNDFLYGDAKIISLVYNSYNRNQMRAHSKSYYRRD